MNHRDTKNLKTMLKDPKIHKRVYDKFPISKDERRGCATEKALRNAARHDFAKKVYDELHPPASKVEYK